MKISIIIPLYNCEKYIDQCISSIISQTYQNWELLIINDFSTDNSVRVTEKFLSDSRVHLYSNNRQLGPGKSRNIGILKSTGHYICFMDGDDYYPNKFVLEKLIFFAIKTKSNICGGSLLTVDSDNKLINDKISGQYFTEYKFINYSEYQHDGGFYRFIYKKTFLIQNHLIFPDLLRMQDPVFFVKSMILAKKFYSIPDYTYAYRKNHKIIIWNEIKIKDHIRGVIILLKLSAKTKLPHLHYLMAKNILSSLQKHKSKLNLYLRIYFFIESMKNINFNLLKRKWEVDSVKITRLKLLLTIF